MNYQTIEPILEYLAEYSSPSLFMSSKMLEDFHEWSPITVEHYCAVTSPSYLKKLLLRSYIPSTISSKLTVSTISKEDLHELHLTYSIEETICGTVLIASLEGKICYCAFQDTVVDLWGELQLVFPDATFKQESMAIHQQIASHITKPSFDQLPIELLLIGTPFQVEVWNILLKIPVGELVTYTQIASALGNKSAARAVGSAVGSNTLAYIVPCHRVIRNDGVIGEYRWKSPRKRALLALEITSKARAISADC